MTVILSIFEMIDATLNITPLASISLLS